MKKKLFIMFFILIFTGSVLAAEPVDSVIIKGTIKPSIPEDDDETLIVKDEANGFAVAVRILTKSGSNTIEETEIDWNNAMPLSQLSKNTVLADITHTDDGEDSVDSFALIYAIAGNTEKKINRMITVKSKPWADDAGKAEFLSLTVDGDVYNASEQWYAQLENTGDDKFTFYGQGRQDTFLPVAYSTVSWEADDEAVAGEYNAQIILEVQPWQE